jgi:cysteine desulfurase
MAQKTLYFDNAATTMMSKPVLDAMVYWCNKGNPSSAHGGAKLFHDMRVEFEQLISSHASIKHDDYYFIWTSGASEANCTLIKSVVDAYIIYKKAMPHLIVSSIEHKSIIAQVEYLQSIGIIELTMLPVDHCGCISPTDLSNSIKQNTALVCIQAANNETGACNDLMTISDICHRKDKVDQTQPQPQPQGQVIPIHCDAVQSFGKRGIKGGLVDSFSISFHKFGGPPGVGCLVVRKEFYDGYGLVSSIFGSQNDSHRGGTENVPGIGASYAATKINFASRDIKNKHLLTLRNYTLTALKQFTDFPLMSYTQYLKTKVPNALVVISSKLCLPHIMLISFVDSKKRICNSKLRSHLNKHGVIVSVGSACNTKSEKASHVLDAINADEFVRAGTLRVSFCDDTTTLMIDTLVKALALALKETIKK